MRILIRLAIVTFSCVCALLAADPPQHFVFPDIATRFPVGDTNAPNPISDTEGPKALASADMNRDGLPDIIAANLDGSISVLLANTNEFLSPQILTPARGILTNSSLRAVIVSDVNGDNIPDVVAGDIARKGLVVLIGFGDGTLFPDRRIDLGPVRAMVAGDFNKDGKTDLLVACSPPDCEYCLGEGSPEVQPPGERFLVILSGNGDGTFGAPRPLLTPGVEACFYDVEAADIDGDNDLDALALDFTACVVSNSVVRTRRLQIFTNPGSGDFATNSPALVLEPAGEGPRAFRLGYLDEPVTNNIPGPNATLDIVIANRDSASIDVFMNNGNLSFAAPITYSVGDAPRDVGIGDIDQDGHSDLVIVNRRKSTLSLLRGTQGGKFELSDVELPTGASPRNIVLTDLNQDGFLDAAVNNRETGDISALHGDRNYFGFLLPGDYYWVGNFPSSLVARDLDGDGDVDFASVALRSHKVYVRLNDGTGNFADEKIYPVNELPAIIAAAHLNSDTNLDLVVSCFGGTNAGLLTLVGQGGGNFATPIVNPLSGLHPYWIRLGHLDSDTLVDAAVGTHDGQLAVLRGRGDGTFEPPVLVRHTVTGRPLGIALGDFDNDNKLDIATSVGEVLLNDGQFFDTSPPLGIWAGPVKKFPAGSQAWAIEADHLDNDGNLDLLLALTFVRPDPIGTYFGRGDGSFAEPTIYEGPDVGVVAMAAADMDDDGIKDIVIGNRCAATIMIMKGLGDRKYRFEEIIKAYSVEDVEIADLNGDRRLDILGAGLGVWPLINGATNQFVRPTFAALAEMPPRGLYINELMAQNRDYKVVEEISPDWVEIFNNTPFTVDLTGWQMLQSDADGRTNRWPFPPQTSIGPFGHLTVYCERSPITNGLSASFELSSDGENVALIRPDSTVEDWVTFPALPRDASYARSFDAAPYFSINAAPTFGTVNTPAPNMRPAADRKDPYIGPGGSALGVNARFFDDVAIAYASVVYRVEGQSQFHEIVLNDDGESGDKLPNDGYYGGILPTNLPAGGAVEYYLRVIDLEGQVETSPENAEATARFHRVSVPVPQSGLRLTEVVAANSDGLTDERGQKEDWIELTNFGSTPVTLDGLALTKDYFDHANAWLFPSNTVINPGARAIIYCDDDPEHGPLHTTFTLLRDGDRIFLVDAASWTVLDSLSFNALPSNTSLGVLGNGVEAQLLAWPTPAAENIPLEDSNTFWRVAQTPVGPQLEVRWLLDGNNYAVQSSPDLRTWTLVPGVTALGEGLHEAKIPIQPSNLFFRIVDLNPGR